MAGRRIFSVSGIHTRVRHAARQRRPTTPRGPRPLTPAESARVDAWLERLPYYRPLLRILVGEGLGEKRRRLMVGMTGDESRMHAASFLPRWKIVIDQALLRRPRELARILYHEVFHFVWARLGNPLRQSYEEMLRREWAEGAKGELGWSAEMRKLALGGGHVRRRSRKWSEYVCESFCDSAAWFCLGAKGSHREWTLKPRFRRRRSLWLSAADILPRLHLGRDRGS